MINNSQNLLNKNKKIKSMNLTKIINYLKNQMKKMNKIKIILLIIKKKKIFNIEIIYLKKKR